MNMHDHPPFPSHRQAMGGLIACMLAYILAMIDRMILSLMVDPIKSDLHLNDFQMGLLQGMAFAICYCLFGLPLGRLADRISRKWIIVGGLAVWSVATALCSIADSFAHLAVARVFVGIGEAALIPAGVSMLSDSFRPDKLARALSLFAYSPLIGVSAGLMSGGWLLQWASGEGAALLGVPGVAAWRLVFLLAAAPSVILIIAMLFMREPSRQEPPTATSTVTVRMTLAHMWARREEYAPIYGAVVLFSVMMYGGMTWFPTYLIRNIGMSPQGAGVSLGLVHLVGGAIGAIGGPMMLDRFVARNANSPHLRTLLIVALGAALPAILAPLTPFAAPALLLWLVVQAFLGAYYGVALAALQLITPNRMRGLNAALFSFCITLVGLGIGSAFVGALTNFVFRDPLAVGRSLALVNSVVAITSIAVLLSRLRPARAAPVHG